MRQPHNQLAILIAVIFGMVSNAVYAQNALSRQIEKELRSNQAKAYALFSRSTERSQKVDSVIRNVSYLKLDRAKLSDLHHDNSSLITLELPLSDGSTISVNLMQYDFRTGDYRNLIRTSSGLHTIENVKGRFYRGALKGVGNSFAAFSFFEDEIGAVFSDKLNGNYNLVLNREHPGSNNENYILYRESDILKDAPAGCSLTEKMNSLAHHPKATVPAGMGVFETACNAVRISVFADSFVYQYNGRNVAKSIEYINTIFNVVSALYANDNLFLQQSETVLSTVGEGYTFSDPFEVLERFGNLIQVYGFNGDAAHYITGYRDRTGFAPLGGLAWTGGLCLSPVKVPATVDSTYAGPYSIVNTEVLTSIPSLPTYSWDVEVCAHELGHTIGSPHTQDCSWPGGPIDNCVEPEGGCTTVGPTPVGGGTIMSYCHLTTIGINFANGFGPLPRGLLKDRIATAACLRTGVPDSTLQDASQTIIANAECFDGAWVNYFFDNNTANPSDDIYVLSIKKGTLDIGNVRDTDFVVSMTTNSFYGRDTVPRITAAYADTNWREINRKWTVHIAADKQPYSTVLVRFPYLEQDITDISSFASPVFISDTSLTFLKYTTDVPASGTGSFASRDVRRLPYRRLGATTKAWKDGATALYRYVEVILDSGIHGGTLGYQRRGPSSLQEWGAPNGLRLQPNPVSSTLTVVLPVQHGTHLNFSVFDNLGRTVYQSNTENPGTDMHLNVGTLSSGVYTLQCMDMQTGEKYFSVFQKQ